MLPLQPLPITSLLPFEVPSKRCPRCEETKPLDEFGICNSRIDGHNAYCKICIRQKIAIVRASLKTYNESKKKRREQYKQQTIKSVRAQARKLRKLTPEDRVREAIRLGAETQAKIISVTKLPKDEVGEYIATLLLWDFSIRTEVIDGVRKYFTNEPGQIRRKPVRPVEPRSNGVSSIYFAA